MTELTNFAHRRKSPTLNPEDFAHLEMLFKNYCGYQEWKLFFENEPVIDEDELDQLRTPACDDIEESCRYERS